MNLEQSKKCYERSLKVAPGGVHSPVRAFKSVGGTPVFFKSASGGTLTSVDGDTYVDFCQSFGPLILGHRDPDVQQAVLNAVNTAWSFGACEPYSLDLAEWMTSRLPWVQKIRFVSSGTEAVMSALRVARAATGRSKILKFEGCYHGHTDSLLVKAGSGLAGPAASSSAGVSEAVASETIVSPLDDEEHLVQMFEKYGKEIAAVIIEPLPANYGLLVQRKEFLLKIEELAKANGALLIFDEVISGFRVALGGMAEVLGMKPDLVTYGKVIGGGFPVGAYGGRKELMDMVAPAGPVYQAGTLSANPVGMIAGLATLQKVEKVKAYEALDTKAAKLADSLNARFADRKLPYHVSRVGSIFWLHMWHGEPIHRLDQIPAKHSQNFQRVFHKALEKGIYLAPSAHEVGFMSLAHTDEQINKTIEVLDKAVFDTHV